MIYWVVNANNVNQWHNIQKFILQRQVLIFKKYIFFSLAGRIAKRGWLAGCVGWWYMINTV